MNDPLEDGISKVELLDHMGSDLTVVNAARVSYNKESNWEFFQDGIGYVEGELKPEDVRLIKYLASHGHWTPFSQPQLQFRIRMPIFIAREWFRHTVGFTRNEVSRRYVNSDPEYYYPRELRNKPELGKSKQGSSGVHEDSQQWSNVIDMHSHKLVEMYNLMIVDGVAPEQARIILPLGLYTEFIETASLYAYSRLCKLRIQEDAQLETRKFAEAVSEAIQPLFPESWLALNG